MNNWQIKSLGEICTIQTGKYDANHAKDNGKYRFYTCAFEFMYCDTNRFNGECIILPGNGANVGEVFYYNGEFDAYQRTYVLNNIKTNSKYLFYHLQGNWKRKNQDKQFGSATNYIRIGNFTDYEVPVPPLETQQAIVSKIEELFSKLDKGIEDLKNAQQQLKTYRQSVLKWAFEGKLTNEIVKDGELPKCWRNEELNNLAEMRLGKMLDKNKNKGNYHYYLGNISVRWGTFNFDKLSQMRFEESEEEKYDLKDGDLVICEGGEPGRCAIWKKDFPKMKIQKALHRVRVNNNLSVKFLFHFIYYSGITGSLEKYFTGTTIKHLTGNGLKKVRIPLPNLVEQHHIVQEIESRLSVADKMEESIVQSLLQAEALRQSILKKAFSGELV